MSGRKIKGWKHILFTLICSSPLPTWSKDISHQPLWASSLDQGSNTTNWKYGSYMRTGHHLTFVCLPKFLVFGFNLKRKGFRRHCDHLRQGLPRFSVKNWYQWQQHCNSEIYRSRQGTVRVEPHSTVMNALLLVPHKQWSLQHHSQHEYFRSQHSGCKFSFFLIIFIKSRLDIWDCGSLWFPTIMFSAYIS